ncbi:AAA family ATPase [Streptomyces sp. B6B3]|uniref:helix-turn-helix domain-containing protein n=1 Tax=Streptomyces sp. B6B3 TaxID=3153570 RepID=UPI00325EB095
MASPFVEELQRILETRGISWRRLADLTGYHPSWLSKIRNGRPPPVEVVRRCDEVLGVNGRLIALSRADGLTPAQLPAAPACFVGREAELTRMGEVLLEDRRVGVPAIVVISGPPGVGKTASALRCAHEVKERESTPYRHGQLYADLHGFSPAQHPAQPEDVLAEFLSALQVPDDKIPDGLAARTKLYRTLLAYRKMLVVLDNANNSQQVQPLLPATSGCAVIVTSRSRLTGLALLPGAARITLGPLPERESVALLRTSMGPGITAEDRELAALAQQSGHLPLALRIAAERAVSHPFREISSLLREFRAHPLNALSLDDSIAVRTSFSWSYARLDADAARTYRLFGLHWGPALSAEAAAALSGTSAAATGYALDRLVGTHLVEAAPAGRYRLSPLLRLYAEERCQAEDTSAARAASVRRLLDWYVGSAQAAAAALGPRRRLPAGGTNAPRGGRVALSFGSPQAARDWFDAEAPGAVAVVRVAVEYGYHAAGWQWGLALCHYFRLLRVAGRVWVGTQARALQAARLAGNRRAENSLLLTLAEARRWQRHYRRAQRLLFRALTEAASTGDRYGEGRSQAAAAALAADQGHFDRAHEHAASALAIFEEVDDQRGQGEALLTLADCRTGPGRRDRSTLSVLRDASRLFQEAGDDDGEGRALARMAQHHQAAGVFDEALACAELGLEARRRAGSRWGEQDGLARRGLALSSLHRRDEAAETWRRAAAVHETVDDLRVTAVRESLQSADHARIARALAEPVW